MMRIEMQAIVTTATPNQTNTRWCVIVLAMKLLMRMSKPAFNTIQHEHANVAGGSANRARADELLVL
ncbi:MAG TPA: hypothetical protein VNE84_01550 [Candidatus Limnocylindria bacterium]|nr:hypothetical protein [Candidatus Limnocylindria bacterium]